MTCLRLMMRSKFYIPSFWGVEGETRQMAKKFEDWWLFQGLECGSEGGSWVLALEVIPIVRRS